MWMSVCIVLVLLTAVFLRCKKMIHEWITHRRAIMKLPQVPRFAFPIIGHSYLLRGDPSNFFHYASDMAVLMVEELKFKFVNLWLGPVPLIIIFHPDAAEVILKSSKQIEKSIYYRFLHPWLGTGLLTSSGEKWKQRRRLITPSFHFNILQDFLDVMNEHSRTMLANLERQYNQSTGQVNVGKAVTLCALDIICETAMGQAVNVQNNKNSAYVQALYRISEIIQRRQRTPYLWWDVSFKKMKLGVEHDRLLAHLHSFTRSVISERMMTKSSKKDASKRMAFLDVLMHAKNEDGTKLSLEDIQEEVDTFMFEGHDTTAAAMTWALYLIGRHPHVQRRIHDELDAVFGEDRERDITMEDLGRLQYLECTIKESLRIFPSVPLIARVTTEDCEIDGKVIPKNTQVVVFIYVIHHNPLVWEDPEDFIPDRFSKENYVDRNPFSYVPFSAGPRNCIGQRFAMQEEKVLLGQILRRFTIVSTDEREDIKATGDLILRPETPLNISLIKREKNKQ